MSILRFRAEHFFLLAIACWLLPAVGTVASDAPRYYSIKMNQKLIGYSAVESVAVENGLQQHAKLTSKTVLKVALLGKVRRIDLVSQTLVDSATARPLSYKLTDTTNDLIRYFESKFIGETVRTWNYREGDSRGEPIEMLLPAGALILGNNNFAHWQLLMDQAREQEVDGKTELAVFLPETGQVEQFDFVRRESESLLIGGEQRECVPWEISVANLRVLVDATTNEFVRLELPSQKTTIERADAKVIKLAQKTEAEELLARHFTQSNVAFTNDRKVQFLKAKLNVTVIGSGVGTEVTSLVTGMQAFEGKKVRDLITGEVVVRSVQVDEAKSPPFPTSITDSAMEAWLIPSLFIESDDSEIIDFAGALTQEAKTRWEAVQYIGNWIHKEIAYTIADTPSAELAFEKREGDCGPHSTLMVAMLRALEIPARLVGGVVYTPSFGGSFGQHAWVEVHLGEMGWVAVDPTTGEFERMNATHIKLFEGLGGVLPTSIEVVDFKPANPKLIGESASAVDQMPVAKPLAWVLGRSYTFRYMKGEKEIGSETFTVDKVKHEGENAIQMSAKTQLKVNFLTSIQSDTTLLVAPNAAPISFRQDLSALVQKVKIECSFGEGVVKEVISGTTSLKREIKLPKQFYCFDNNLMGSWVVICSQLELELGEGVQITTFHPSTMQTIPLTFTPTGMKNIQLGGKQIECFECEVSPIKNTFWISKDGRFLRCQQGDLVIELVEGASPE
ncbi:MAG: transglutaminase-like domain-containing protein [Rubripirellula sp.]|nr:transglutaminase-like domain-containing protein [Rubripirellula sp.]